MTQDRISQEFFYQENNIDLNNIAKCFYRISSKGLILDKDGRFLIMKQNNEKWDLPGGGLGFGETPAQGITREIEEEMGLKVTFIAKHPSYFLTTTNPDDMWYANIIYLCEVENLDFKSSWECEEIRFVTPTEARKLNIISNIEELCKQFSDEHHN